MRARYFGICQFCGRPIRPGVEIEFLRDHLSVHKTCHSDSQQQTGTSPNSKLGSDVKKRRLEAALAAAERAGFR